jgi:hypothetical protein
VFFAPLTFSQRPMGRRRGSSQTPRCPPRCALGDPRGQGRPRRGRSRPRSGGRHGCRPPTWGWSRCRLLSGFVELIVVQGARPSKERPQRRLGGIRQSNVGRLLHQILDAHGRTPEKHQRLRWKAVATQSSGATQLVWLFRFVAHTRDRRRTDSQDAVSCPQPPSVSTI